MRIITRIVGIIILGSIGGIFMMGIVLPFLKSASLVSSMPFLKHIADGTTVIERTQQLIVNENSALEAAIQNAQKSVVEVQMTEKNTITRAAGIVLTNDGIVMFPIDAMQATDAQYLVRGSDADWLPATFLAKDTELGLALVRAKDAHLTPVNFGDVQSLTLGQRIFALGVLSNGQNFAAEGIVASQATQDHNGQTSLRLDAQQGNGAGLFSLEGEMFGMFVAQHKTISLISSTDIQGFLQSALTQ